MTSAEDSETATAVVALLSALGDARRGGAPAHFRDALVPVAARERSVANVFSGDASPVSERERNPPTTTIVWTCA